MRPSSIKTPKPTLSRLEARKLRDRIVDEQSMAGVLTGSIVGAAGGVIVYLAIWHLILIPLIALFAPGVMAGYLAKLTGKAFQLKYRAICGAVTFVALAAVGLYVDLNPMAILVALPNAVLAVALSRRKLTKDEERAIYRYRMGLDEQ